MAVPSDSAAITAEWLTEALAESGYLGGSSIALVQSERFGEGVLSDVYRLTLTYRSGGPSERQTLIAKLPSSDPRMRQLGSAGGFYQREIAFYRDIAARISLPMPRCPLADIDLVTHNFVILLEDLAPAATVGYAAGMELSQLAAAVECAAVLHTRWWEEPELTALEPVALQLGRGSGEMRYQAGWPRVEAWLASRVSPSTLRVAEQLGGCLRRVQAASAAPPRTLCHGDFHAENLPFRRHNGKVEMFVVDWQLLALARGPFDIGRLMGASAPSDLRREHEMDLLRLYHQRLIEAGVSGYGFEECFRDYRRSLLTGFGYWVQGAAATDLNLPRMATLFDVWARRLDAATQDLGLAEFVA